MGKFSMGSSATAIHAGALPMETSARLAQGKLKYQGPDSVAALWRRDLDQGGAEPPLSFPFDAP
jgi:hypothetical protein